MNKLLFEVLLFLVDLLGAFGFGALVYVAWPARTPTRAPGVWSVLELLARALWVFGIGGLIVFLNLVVTDTVGLLWGPGVMPWQQARVMFGRTVLVGTVWSVLVILRRVMRA